MSQVRIGQAYSPGGGTASSSLSNFSAGVSTFGNTSGNTGTVNGEIIFAGGNNITLSQATGTAGATVTISGANATVATPTISFYQPFYAGTGTIQMVNGSLYLTPVCQNYTVFPGNMTVNTLDVILSVSTLASVSLTNTVSFWAGLYTYNAATLSLANSVLSSFTQSQNAGNSSSWNGVRHYTIHSSLWSAQPTLSQTSYWLGLMMSQSGMGAGLTFKMPAQAFMATSMAGTFGTGSINGSVRGWLPFAGAYTVVTGALPTSIVSSDIYQANSVPHFILNNLSSVW